MKLSQVFFGILMFSVSVFSNPNYDRRYCKNPNEVYVTDNNYGVEMDLRSAGFIIVGSNGYQVEFCRPK